MSVEQEGDQINHPSHYTFGEIEVIDVIEDWEMGYHLGNVIKYVGRAPHKGSLLVDLKKARWYLNRRIEQIEGTIESEGLVDPTTVGREDVFDPPGPGSGVYDG